MPVIIEEVVISVDVTNDSGNGAARATATVNVDDQQRMIAECVERVMQILQQKEER